MCVFEMVSDWYLVLVDLSGTLDTQVTLTYTPEKQETLGSQQDCNCKLQVVVVNCQWTIYHNTK